MRVIILSKAPVSGRVKTRLMPQYTADQAAELHAQMIHAVLSKVCGMFKDVWLAVDDVDHDYFRQLDGAFSFQIISQGEGNLGQRLAKLMHQSFAQDCSHVMFLGTDSPHVDPRRYVAAKQALTSFDMAVGPVEDGGYDLITMSKPHGNIFENITWGTNLVFSETTHIINMLDLSLKVLDFSFDLDRAEDLKRAPPDSWLPKA